jgi:aminoglycoside 2'-N-acetyltransferase I
VQVEAVESRALPAGVRHELLALCEEAYQEELASYFVDIGPGLHLLGRADVTLVSHAMLVRRELEQTGLGKLTTGYVELVATRLSWQRRGYGSELMRALVPHMDGFAIGALSPTNTEFYRRLGWELWRGPLSVRTETGLVPTPDEEVMILRLPATPPALDLHAPLSIEWRPGELW